MKLSCCITCYAALFSVLETSEQGEFGPSCQVHLLQFQRRDGFHWYGEWRVHHPVGQLPHRLGQEERPQRRHPGHTVGHHLLCLGEGVPQSTTNILLVAQVQPRQPVPGSGFS